MKKGKTKVYWPGGKPPDKLTSEHRLPATSIPQTLDQSKERRGDIPPTEPQSVRDDGGRWDVDRGISPTVFVGEEGGGEAGNEKINPFTKVEKVGEYEKEDTPIAHFRNTLRRLSRKNGSGKSSGISDWMIAGESEVASMLMEKANKGELNVKILSSKDGRKYVSSIDALRIIMDRKQDVITDPEAAAAYIRDEIKFLEKEISEKTERGVLTEEESNGLSSSAEDIRLVIKRLAEVFIGNLPKAKCAGRIEIEDLLQVAGKLNEALTNIKKIEEKYKGENSEVIKLKREVERLKELEEQLGVKNAPETLEKRDTDVDSGPPRTIEDIEKELDSLRKLAAEGEIDASQANKDFKRLMKEKQQLSRGE